MVPRRTPWVALFAVLVFAAGWCVPSAAPAGAASNGSWSVYPTTLLGGSARVVFSPDLTPGTTESDSVTISNLSGSSLSFDLFAADAFNTPGGGLSLRRKVDPVEGIGAWIHLAHSSAVVPAHASAAIPFLIVVPSNATPGDHVGGIVAEQTTGTPSSQGSIPVNVVQAVGVRVYGRVKGPLVKHLGVAEPTIDLTHNAGALFGATTQAVVSVRVANRGNVVLTPLAHLRISSTFGSPVLRTFSTGPLLPGESVARHFSVPVRTTGEVHAQLSAAASGVTATATSSLWSLPWGLIAIIVAVVALVAFTLVRRVRRKKRRQNEAIPADRPDQEPPREPEVPDTGAEPDGSVERAET